MNKQQGVDWFNSIRNGAGVNRSAFPGEWKGDIASKIWNDAKFTLGIEYGVLIALREIFGIEKEDL